MEHEDEGQSEALLPPGAVAVVKVAGAVDKEDAGAAAPLLPRGTSNQIAQTDPSITGIFIRARAIDPPHDPEYMAWLFEHSSSWRQCVDAYVTNIDGFGHHLEPEVDLDSKDADERITDALVAATGKEPTPEEVKTYKVGLRVEMRREKVRLEAFLKYACLDCSFVRLRRRMRQDLEITGNAYWEVIRNGAGEVAEFVHMPSTTVRLTPLDDKSTTFKVRIKTSPFEYGEVETTRRRRRYVQIVGASSFLGSTVSAPTVVFFKEFGDTRPISRSTGDVVALGADGQPQFQPGDGPATEVIHFKLDNARRTDYGVTRYAGNIVTMQGQRESEEVILDYFDNNTVPRLLLMIAGADQKSVDETHRSIEESLKNIKGRKSANRILIVGATPANSGSQTARVTMNAQPLTDAQMKDAVFGQYDVRCMDKNGMTARLPRMLRGDIQDVNRASADASLAFAEAQVFAPERQEFDDFINRHVFADMGIRFWRFASYGPMPRDSAAVIDILKKGVDAGLLTINEARAAGVDVFNRPLPDIKEDWASQLLPLLLKWPPGAVGETELPSAPGGPPSSPTTSQPAEPPAPAAKGAVDVPAVVRTFAEVRDALLEQVHQHALAGLDSSATNQET